MDYVVYFLNIQLNDEGILLINHSHSTLGGNHEENNA